ncbi:MAG: hypothetical protein K2W95_34610 [Candidatus Obscuribacterales bacterium]|nr:hypothetical protein [Candidatus Obscuribacterales bacterium]
MKQSHILNKQVLLSTSIPAERIGSVFLVFVGLVVAIAPQFASNRDEVGPLILGLMFLLGFGCIWGGIALGDFSKRIDVFLDRTDSSICISKKGWFSREHSESISNGDIKRFEIATTKDSDGDAWYQVMLVTRTERQLAVSKSFFTREEALHVKQTFENAVRSGVNTNGISDKSALKRLANGDSRLKIFSILFTCFVIAMPFVAAFLAEHANFTRLVFTAGVPDLATADRVNAMIASLLHDGEKLLWVGQPEVGREASLKMWFFIPFAVIWTLFSSCWTGIAVLAARETRNPMSWLMALFGVPFVLIGLGMLSTPYFSREQELNTVYALTTDGAFRVTLGRPCRLVDYDEQDFGPVEVTRYSSNRCDVLFRKDASEGQKHPYGGFYGVEAGSTAAQILEARYRSR